MIYKAKIYKLGRRLGAGVFEKCQTQKFALKEGKKQMSKAGSARPKRQSDYGKQLIEKQRMRFMYGISEKQFRNYIEKSMAQSEEKASNKLFHLLENRADNVIYRMGLVSTRRMARQVVSHGHILVNGKKITIPSYHLSEGDVVSVREGSKTTHLFTDKADLKSSVAPWITFDAKKLEGTIKGIPSNPDPFLNFQSVIEFYTR